jgi:hypothetical protein
MADGCCEAERWRLGRATPPFLPVAGSRAFNKKHLRLRWFSDKMLTSQIKLNEIKSNEMKLDLNYQVN